MLSGSIDLQCLKAVVRLYLLAAIGLTSGAAAQTVTDGNSTFTMATNQTVGASIRTGTNGGSLGVLIAGGDTTDQLFQHWWWYRVNGVNGREFAFSNRTSNVSAGNVLTLTYVEPEGLQATLRYALTDGVDMPASCLVSCELTLQTTSPTPLSVAVFGYVDLDLEGNTLDSAAALGPAKMRVVDQATGFFGEIAAPSANAYRVAHYPGVRDMLTDADVDNFNNTGLPLAPGDFSGGYQWNVTVSQGSPAVVRLSFSLNSDANPCGAAIRGDANCDNRFDNFDIDCFVTALVSGQAGWTAACSQPGCVFNCVLDVNRDGRVDNFDIDPFVTCVVNLGCP